MAEGVKARCEENVVDDSTIIKAGKTMEEAIGGGAKEGASEIIKEVRQELGKDILTDVAKEPPRPEYDMNVDDIGKAAMEQVADQAKQDMIDAADAAAKVLSSDVVLELLPAVLDKLKLFSETGPIAGIFSTVGGFFKNIFSAKGEGEEYLKVYLQELKIFLHVFFLEEEKAGYLVDYLVTLLAFLRIFSKAKEEDYFVELLMAERFFGKLFSSDGPISSFFTKTGNFFKNLLGPSGLFRVL